MDLRKSIERFHLGKVKKPATGDKPGEVIDQADNHVLTFELSAGRSFIADESGPKLSDETNREPVQLGSDILFQTDSDGSITVWGRYNQFEQITLTCFGMMVGVITVRPTDCGDMGYVESGGCELLLLLEGGFMMCLTKEGQLVFTDEEIEMPEVGRRLIFRLDAVTHDLANPWGDYQQFRDLLFPNESHS